MKNLVLVFMAFVALSVASCTGCGNTTEVATVDSTVIDSTVIDSTVVDSVDTIEVVDSSAVAE